MRNHSMSSLSRSARAWAAVMGASGAMVLIAAAPASASFGVTSFDGSITNQDGSPATQAGSHPFQFTTAIHFNTTTDANGNPKPDGNPKDAQVDLPPGLIGDPGATSQCTRNEVLDPGTSPFAAGLCPVSSQVGIASVSLANGLTIFLPLYNMVPPPHVPAQFAFILPSILIQPPVPTFINAKIRTGGDYGVTAGVTNISQGVPTVGTSLTFWGVPGDPGHDDMRGSCLGIVGGSNGTCPADGFSQKPLLTLPTSCAGPQKVTLHTDSWQHPGAFLMASFVTHDLGDAPIGFDGCDKLDFDPSMTVQPTTARSASPTGLQVDLHLPQNDAPNGLAEADLKSVAITLPQGFSVSPSAADGLQACAPSQIGLENAGEPSCPAASRIGSVKVVTPLLADPLEGSIFLAKQNDNPFNSTLAMYLVAEGHGALIKLAGKIDADPVTGQLTTTFDNNPQLPFSGLHVQLFGGPRAALSSPTTCGTKTATATLTSWSGKTVQRTSQFDISGDGHGGPCAPAQFKPSVDAGLVDPVAGRSSDFVLRVQRADLDNELKTISTTLPPGLLAKVAGVPLCSDAQATSNSCPAASQIGHVQVGSGPGSSPFYITDGKAFLTEGYKGAPFGMAITVPAVAGPFDLGMVNVRAALRIDPVTAQVTVAADPMPRILEGIPLQVRDVRVVIDRPGFMQAPTSCGPTTIAATVGSYAGDSASVSDRFQVGDCAALPYRPKLGIRLTDKSQTRDGEHPGVDAVLTQRAGQANNKRVQVALPLSLALDPDNAQTLCEFADGLKDQCPSSSIVGFATAVTPLLDKPLTGPVYFVKGVRVDSKGVAHKTLPTLLVTLRGQIALDLRATSTVKANKLVTTFGAIPDAPVSSFRLRINGGKHGILVVTGGKDICKATQTAVIQSDGQNGKTHDFTTRMSTPCGLRVLSAKRSSRSVHVKVGGIGKGKLTVTGAGIRRTSRSLHSSLSIATVIAPLTAAGRSHAPKRVRVRFDPAGPAKAKTVSARVR